MRKLKRKGWPVFAGKITGLQFTPDSRKLVTGSATALLWDQHVRVFDLETLRETSTLKSHKGGVHSIALSTDGRFAASGGGRVSRRSGWLSDTDVRLWDLESGECTARLVDDLDPSPAPRGTCGLAFCNNDQNLLVATSCDRFKYCFRLWDLETREELRRFDAQSKALKGMALSRCGNIVIAVSSPGWYAGDDRGSANPPGATREELQYRIAQTVKIFDFTTGEPLDIERYPNPVSAVAAFSHSDRVATAGGEVVVWDLTEGRAAWRAPAKAPVHAVAVTPDDRFVVTAEGGQDDVGAPWEDCRLRLLDASDGETRGILEGGHRIAVTAVACSPDGRYIASGDQSGNLFLWDAPTVAD